MGGETIPKPQSSPYSQAASAQADAIKSQVGMLGHNPFRTDVYRVTEGYMS